MTGKSGVLQTHTRIKTDADYGWFLLRCERRKEKFGKTHLQGFILDVTSYLAFAKEDSVLLEYKRRNEEQITRSNSKELTLIDILDPNYLREIQTPLKAKGLYSGIFDEDEKLICTADGVKGSLDNYKFEKRAGLGRAVSAYWVIASNNEAQLTEYAPLLELLADTVSRIVNSFVVLYNEMGNSERANKLLSEHIEQQILENNIYNIILERSDASGALESVIKLVGEFMGMKRICIYNDLSADRKFKLDYEWRAASCADFAPHECTYDETEHILERLDYTDMYIPPYTGSENKTERESLTAASLNGDGKRFGLITFAPRAASYIPTAQESKILRSVSQITATLLIQKKADEKLDEANNELLRLAHFDPILEIPNRSMLDKDIEAELEIKEPGAAAVLKITNLHTFNELFGHEYTDSILRDVAKHVAQMPVENLTIYRFSGSTLMFLMRNTNENGAKAIVEKLIERFAEPWKQKNGEHYLDISIGVTFFPTGHSSRDSIYRAAALSLYKAAEYGTNSYAFYSDDFAKTADVSYGFAQKLRDSINNGMKDFSIKYQPVFNLSEGESFTCYEALVAWESLPTQKLIALAENIGIDIALDSWVMENACNFCKEMQKDKPDFAVSVNVTMREIHSGAVISMAEKALTQSGLEARFLWVEVPERVFTYSREGVMPVMKKLREMGVHLIIDSFGADFGGLRLLKHPYMDMVKVDFSLFTNIFGEFDEIWVNAVAKLASPLRHGICVKRVENAEQLEQAKKYGVRYGQGWHFEYALTREEIIEQAQK
jgi:diguanylate cyclase (GGDEF)-like protein